MMAGEGVNKTTGETHDKHREVEVKKAAITQKKRNREEQAFSCGWFSLLKYLF
jgi:hypothetical protein